MGKKFSSRQKQLVKIEYQAEGDEWIKRLPRKGRAIEVNLPHDAVICATGLALPFEIDNRQWYEIGVKLLAATQSIQWAIGDWWAFGCFSYGDRKAYAMLEPTRYTYGYLMNLGSVARKVPPSSRNELLSFTHHVAVSKLHPSEQQELLRRAEDECLSVAQFNEAIRQHQKVEDGTKRKSEIASAMTYIEGILRAAKKSRALVSRINVSHLEHLDDNRIDKFENELATTAAYWNGLRDSVKEFRQQRGGEEAELATTSANLRKTQKDPSSATTPKKPCEAAQAMPIKDKRPVAA